MKQIVDSLAPLARLEKLRYLALPNLKARDNTLSPLCSLSTLEQLHVAGWWNTAELAFRGSRVTDWGMEDDGQSVTSGAWETQATTDAVRDSQDFGEPFR